MKYNDHGNQANKIEKCSMYCNMTEFRHLPVVMQMYRNFSSFFEGFRCYSFNLTEVIYGVNPLTDMSTTTFSWPICIGLSLNRQHLPTEPGCVVI